MRLSSLCVAAVLLLSVVTFAQHSSGGGGGGSSSSGSSGGSSGGGGGSHGGGGSSSSGGSGGSHSSGGSGSSSSAHSSGGSSSHASSGYSSSGHGSIATPATHPSVNNSRPVSNSHTNNAHSNNERSVREPNPGARRIEMPEKRGFFGFLRHPFRRPDPNPSPKTKTVTDLRRPVPCLRGPCAVCPPHAGGCGATFYLRHEHDRCTPGEIWTGGSCLLQTQFLDSCNALRMTMQRQEQRMRATESRQQSACAAGSSQACMDSASAAQSEAALYGSLQQQYQRCMQRSLASQPFAGFGLRGYAAGRLLEPFDLQFNYP